MIILILQLDFMYLLSSCSWNQTVLLNENKNVYIQLLPETTNVKGSARKLKLTD